MLKPHGPECDCETCERLNLGAPLYREIAEELASDDPQVIDPIWLDRCQTRIDALALLPLALRPSTRHAVA
ncbi:MAG TPA: hypothetical protein PKI03_40030 [Pseudomonadota bacterium]|nr:hypothetical protein [Pseudomonadota bacterium]